MSRTRAIGRIPVRDVRPAVESGNRPAKAVVGETFEVTATVFREGHDAVGCDVVVKGPDGKRRPFLRMAPGAPGTDRWHAELAVPDDPSAEGMWSFTVEGWSDPLGTWWHDAPIKVQAGVDVDVGLPPRRTRRPPRGRARQETAPALTLPESARSHG